MKRKKLVSIILTSLSAMAFVGCTSKKESKTTDLEISEISKSENISYESTNIESSELISSSEKSSIKSTSTKESKSESSKESTSTKESKSESSKESTSTKESKSESSKESTSTKESKSESSKESTSTKESESESSKESTSIKESESESSKESSMVESTCKVTLDFNYENSFTAHAEFKVGDQYELMEPTRSNYEFLGWYYNDILIPVKGTWNISQDVVLKAMWARIYKVTLDVNGGDYLSSNTLDFIENQEYELPTPKRDHYDFLGWYDKNGELIDSTGIYSFNDDITLTAKWKYYNIVTLDVNDGDSLPSNSMKVYSNDNYVLPTPTRTNYRFLGWYNENEELVDSEGKWNNNSDITLKAKWIFESKVTLDLDYNGSKTEYLYYVLDETYTLPEPTREGYTFVCWNYNSQYVLQAGKWYFSENVTLVAEWEINTYILYLDADGGSGYGYSQILLDYNETYTLPEVYKNNYDFLGWYDGNNKINGNTITIKKDTHLKAHWSYNANKYLIIYDVDNSIVIDSKYQNVLYGETYTLKTPSKSGYTFDGWYDSNGNYYTQNGEFDFTDVLVLTPNFYQEGFTFSLLNNKSYGVSYSGTSQIVNVPSKYHGKNVTEINYNGFYHSNYIKTINIPNTVTVIGASAFKEQSYLTTINLPDSITEIGSSAFFYCEALESITIPNKVRSIGVYTFAGCKSLKDLVLPNSLTSYDYTAIENTPKLYGTHYFGGLYLGSENNPYMVLFAPLNSEVDYLSIHPDCKWIQPGAFANHTGLKSVVINTNYADISYKLFLNCTSLTSVTFNVGQLFKIEKSVFDGCKNLETVTFNNYACYSIGDCAFLECAKLKTITITNQVRYIGYGAFEGTALTSVTFDDPNNWHTSLSDTDNPFEYLKASDLKTKSKAATYLKDTYSQRFWFKDEVEED